MASGGPEGVGTGAPGVVGIGDGGGVMVPGAGVPGPPVDPEQPIASKTDPIPLQTRRFIDVLLVGV
jgi:hypothetical protein